MADTDILDSDLVVIRLSLRGRDESKPISLDETVLVSDLGVANVAGEVPVFDNDTYVRLLSSESADDRAEGMQMLADFHDATAEFMAAGGATPAESLASAVVDWVVRTQPKGHTYTTDPNQDGFVISSAEINIHGPIQLGDERAWRVTAVGTWG